MPRQARLIAMSTRYSFLLMIRLSGEQAAVSKPTTNSTRPASGGVVPDAFGSKCVAAICVRWKRKAATNA